MSKINFKALLLEGLMIVFSVLFALFINHMAEDRKTQQKKNLAIAQIKTELEDNLAVLTIWQTNHIQIHERLEGIVKQTNDTLKTQLLQYDYFNFGLITNNKSLIQNMVTNTAWETAKTINIISEFDYKLIQQLTYVYKLQDIITEKSLNRILDFYFNKDSQNMEFLDANLQQFNLMFSELVGQEYFLINELENALKKLKEEN